MRIFDRDEAVALLGRLRPLVAELLAARRALAIELLEAETARHMRVNHNEVLPRSDERGLRDAQLRIVKLVEKIQVHGCIVKDVDLGLVDFPSILSGKLVNLCWKMDEADIVYWHGMDEGFAARKPIAETRL